MTHRVPSGLGSGGGVSASMSSGGERWPAAELAPCAAVGLPPLLLPRSDIEIDEANMARAFEPSKLKGGGWTQSQRQSCFSRRRWGIIVTEVGPYSTVHRPTTILPLLDACLACDMGTAAGAAERPRSLVKSALGERQPIRVAEMMTKELLCCWRLATRVTPLPGARRTGFWPACCSVISACDSARPRNPQVQDWPPRPRPPDRSQALDPPVAIHQAQQPSFSALQACSQKGTKAPKTVRPTTTSLKSTHYTPTYLTHYNPLGLPTYLPTYLPTLLPCSRSIPGVHIHIHPFVLRTSTTSKKCDVPNQPLPRAASLLLYLFSPCLDRQSSRRIAHKRVLSVAELPHHPPKYPIAPDRNRSVDSDCELSSRPCTGEKAPRSVVES
jgi:hypothetical protein